MFGDISQPSLNLNNSIFLGYQYRLIFADFRSQLSVKKHAMFQLTVKILADFHLLEISLFEIPGSIV